jgi:hypothetical protein
MGQKTTIFFSDQLYFLNYTPETNPSYRTGLWTVLFRARPLMGACGAVRMLWDFTKGAHWLIFDVFLKSRNRYGHTRPFGSAASRAIFGIARFRSVDVHRGVTPS